MSSLLDRERCSILDAVKNVANDVSSNSLSFVREFTVSCITEREGLSLSLRNLVCTSYDECGRRDK